MLPHVLPHMLQYCNIPSRSDTTCEVCSNVIVWLRDTHVRHEMHDGTGRGVSKISIRMMAQQLKYKPSTV